LFTGATGGLGRLCVRKLAERGWTVFAVGTNDARLAGLSSLANVIPIKADITDPASIEAARALVASHTSSLDAIVNFAGVTSFTSMVEGDPVPAAQKLFDVNVLGTVRVNRAFFDMVLKGRGRIINCSSEAGWMKSQPFAAPYFMSKHALEAYSDSLRRELIYLGVPVVKIQPGPFDTNITDIVKGGYGKATDDTGYYKDMLPRMRPFLELGLKQQTGEKHLVETVMKAISAKRPRLSYKVGTSRLLSLLEILPDSIVDRIYLALFRRWGRSPKQAVPAVGRISKQGRESAV